MSSTHVILGISGGTYFLLSARFGTCAKLSAVLIVDAANVVGSRPNGWWRDRAGAAQALTGRVRRSTAGGVLSPRVVLVLEGAARNGVEEGVVDGVEVVHAPGEGDDTVAAIAAEWKSPGLTDTDSEATVVVSGRKSRCHVHIHLSSVYARLSWPG